MRRIGLFGLIAGSVLLLSGSLAHAQAGRAGGGSTGGGTGGIGGGSTGGAGGSSSGGGFVGGSSGGFTGSGGSTGTSSGTGFTGGNSFGSAGSTGGTGGMGGRGSTSAASTSVFGKYMGNPLAAGMTTGGVTSGMGSQYARQFPITLSFGQALYNTANVSSSRNSGTSALGGLGGTSMGGTGSVINNRFAGASSVGIRRAPGYVTEPAFEMPVRPTIATVRGDLQDIISRSERLTSRGNIRVLSDGETVVLRGQVSNERERRLAEAMLRLTPGVRQIRNELEVPER